MSATSRVVQRCFRQVCACHDYYKINRCLPESRKEYELCFKKSYTKYHRTFNTKDELYQSGIWKSPPLL